MKDFRFKKNKGVSVEATISSKQRGHGESVIEFPAGTLTLDWYYIPLLDESGAVESLLVVYNDITERRRQEQEIQTLMEDSKKKAEALSGSADVLESGLSRLAEGDLTFVAEIAENDPLVSLKKDYNKAALSIKTVIEEIAKAAHQSTSLPRRPVRARRRSPGPPNRWRYRPRNPQKGQKNSSPRSKRSAATSLISLPPSRRSQAPPMTS